MVVGIHVHLPVFLQKVGRQETQENRAVRGLLEDERARGNNGNRKSEPFAFAPGLIETLKNGTISKKRTVC